MSDHDIINSWELVQTERERWADKLAPKKPIPGADCCEYGVCTGGHGCPVRQTPVNKAPAPKRCDKAKQPCATPWTCAPACRLVTANSDDSSPDEKPLSQRENRMIWLVAGCMIFCLAALVLYQTF